MQHIYPFLWFDDNAEEAANAYVDIFPDSHMGDIVRYGSCGPGPEGSVMSCGFVLRGEFFVALNGGPVYQFSPAVSFVVDCETQEEVDYYWHRLGEGGQTQRCGWLTDRFGLAWQVVPRDFPELIRSPDRAAADRVMAAMMQMTKLDIAELKRAYQGR